MIGRRDFITLAGGAAAAWPLAARAQQAERMQRIGVLMLYPESDPQGQLRAAAFRQELEKLGWTGFIWVRAARTRRRGCVGQCVADRTPGVRASGRPMNSILVTDA